MKTHAYAELLQLPHPVSTRHSPLAKASRAAQFLPFAALAGYEDVLEETARLTQRKITFSEEEKAVLNQKLCDLADQLGTRPTVTVVYWKPDPRKEGGMYWPHTGRVRRIDPTLGHICFEDGFILSIDCLSDIQWTQRDLEL